MALFDESLAPEVEEDRAALALLQHRDDGAPVTDADREAQAVCPTCGGMGEVTRGHQIYVTGRMWQETCPLPPDGCGGTGKRGGK